MSASPIPSFDEIRQTAAEWTVRADSGLTEREKVALRLWREADPRHERAFLEYGKLWARLDQPRLGGSQRELQRDLATVLRRKSLRRRVTAGACLCALFAIGLFWQTERTRVDDSDVAGRIVVVKPVRQTFPDGSIIECPAGTRFTMEMDATSRRVFLDAGEAHFQVAKDPSRPFVVRAQGVDIRAVGTAFAVNLAAGTVEVLVTEGRVVVDQVTETNERSPSGRPAALVQAGEHMVVTVDPSEVDESTVSQPQPISSAATAQRLSWRSTRFEFSGAPLSEVIAAINRVSEERDTPHFVLRDPDLGHLRLSGLFRPDDTQAVIRILENGFGLSVTRTEDNCVEVGRGRQRLSNASPDF